MSVDLEYLSSRGRQAVSIKNEAVANMLSYSHNPYHPHTNPTGNVNFSTADNKLCTEILEEKLCDSNVWKPKDMSAVLKAPTFGGELRTRQAVESFVKHYLKAEAPITAKNIVCFTGVTTAMDNIAFAIGDPGDVILSPSPLYLRIPNDFEERAQVVIEAVPMIDASHSNGKFELTSDRFELAYDKCLQQGRTVKGVLLVSPNNPLGICHPAEELLEIMRWAKKKKLIVLINEIYANSVFDGRFNSVLSYWTKIPDPKRTVWMWGMSKDFAIPGLRFGAIWAIDAELVQCLRRIEFGQLSSIVQQAAVNLLTDREWLEMYRPTNWARMKSAADYSRARFADMGIPTVGGQAAFFITIDMRHLLREQSFDADSDLHEEFKAAGVYMIRGKDQLSPEPGWFRMVFTMQSREELKSGLDRIQKVLENQKK